nr:retrovirus-related Pol polyprotein from transposon TNT 1-94 [Tanacetum cinerariifolium]
MTGNLKLLINFMDKFLGTVKFRNDQIAPILGYGDLVQGAVMIKRVYYVEGLNHNLISVGQLCDADLEVAFRKSTCFIRDLKGNDLLTGSRGTDLYSITLQSTNSPNPICLMAKATSSQAWLWHRRLSHLNFDTINLLSKNDIVVGLPKLKFIKDHLCSSCELEKAKRKSFHSKLTPSSKRRIHHQMSVARTPKQNGIVERGNRTLVEAARTMLSTAKVPLFFWAEAIATTLHAYFAAEGIQHQTSVARTPEQNGVVERRNLIPHHEKTPYHIINDQKPSVKFFHIFGSVCYIVRDGDNLDKIKEKGDECIFVGYSNQSRDYRVFNKRIRVIMESIHVNFDELPLMASDHLSSDPAPECQTIALNHDSLSPANQRQANVTQEDMTVTTSNELDLLFSLMFDELLNGSSKVVSKSSAVSAADAPNQSFLYSSLKEEVYVNQPDGFVDPYHPEKFTDSRRCYIDSNKLQGRGTMNSPNSCYPKDLPKHGMASCDGIGTPMETKHLDADLSGTPVDQTKYRSKVGALMYLTTSRPDIMHATCYCARYQAQPTEKHLTAVKRIFRCLDLRKSTSGGIQIIGGDKLVSWSSKKQDYYGFHFDKIPMYCDSKAAIAISCNHVQHSHTKHIDVRYHFIKEKVKKGIVELFFVGTEYQLADLFTKAFPVERF